MRSVLTVWRVPFLSVLAQFLPSFAGLQQGDMDAETFSDSVFAGVSHSGQIWDHYLGWWGQRDNPNVLWVFFEDLVDDLRSQVARVAAFIGVPASDALLDHALVTLALRSGLLGCEVRVVKCSDVCHFYASGS